MLHTTVILLMLPITNLVSIICVTTWLFIKNSWYREICTTAIIDEVDSILIDEARTPLIISGQSGKSTKLYEACDILAQQLERGEASHEMTKMAAIMGEEVIETGDFVVNEKDKIVNLTEQGVQEGRELLPY